MSNSKPKSYFGLYPSIYTEWSQTSFPTLQHEIYIQSETNVKKI